MSEETKAKLMRIQREIAKLQAEEAVLLWKFDQESKLPKIYTAKVHKQPHPEPLEWPEEPLESHNQRPFGFGTRM